MKTIKFSNNWNKKLDNDYFTTIRLYSKEKFDYYYDLFERKEDVAILLKEQEKSIAKIVDIEVRLMRDIPDFSVMVDVGADRMTFNNLMSSMYSKKTEWNANFTRMIILTIRKEHDI